MVLFAHFRSEGVDLDTVMQELSPDLHLHIDDGFVTLSGDVTDDTTLTQFGACVSTLEHAGLTPLLDRDLLSTGNYDDSQYWGRIHAYVDTHRPRVRIQPASLALFVRTSPADLEELHTTVGIEYSAVTPGTSYDTFDALRQEHFALLQNLAQFIQYVEASKKSSRRADPKVAVHLDEIMELGYDLLTRPQDHRAFTEFLGSVVTLDKAEGKSIYDTLSFVHSAVVLARGELSKPDSAIPSLLINLQKYGRMPVALERVKQLGDGYGDLERVSTAGILDSRYSDASLLGTLVDLEGASQDDDLDITLKLMLRYGSFGAYCQSDTGTLARTVLQTMEEKGFTTAVFTAGTHSSLTLAREKESHYWEENFRDLIADLRKPEYNTFFVMQLGDEEVNIAFKEKVLSLSRPEEGAQKRDISYILNKVKVMLGHCKARIAQRPSGKLGKLSELEERLESLEIQLEFGGRPTGGKLYSRPWHRTLEDFSREDFMLCCASLGGDKQDLIFMGVYNPTRMHLTHFIEGIDTQLGVSLLKAGMTEGSRALLAISPYEANPAMRTALGTAETYRYVLDAMVKAAHDANADYLLIDDIDVKVRDNEGHLVRTLEGKVVKYGETGYDEAKDLVVRYRGGEPCAPRMFRKAMAKAVRKYSSVSHEDLEFTQLEGDNALVQEQFGHGRCHYSIQSVPAVYNPALDYTALSADATKALFDDGYHSQNGVRTVFKVDVGGYIRERGVFDVLV